jgi:hypothetical protein
MQHNGDGTLKSMEGDWRLDILGKLFPIYIMPSNKTNLIS